MTRLILALAAVAPQVLAQSPPGDDDIVVLGRKIANIRIRPKVKIDRGKARQEGCRIIQSTGDPELDGLVCQASSDCVTQMQFDPHKVGSAEANKWWKECIKDRVNVSIDALYDRRSRAKDLP